MFREFSLAGWFPLAAFACSFNCSAQENGADDPLFDIAQKMPEPDPAVCGLITAAIDPAIPRRNRM